MKAKEKTPDLKTSLSSIAAILADNLHKEALAGRIDILGEDQKWSAQFTALCNWFKIEQGISGDDEEGVGIHGFQTALGTDKRAPSRKPRAAKPVAEPANEPPAEADGPATAPGITELIANSNAGDVPSNSDGAGEQDAAVRIAARRIHPVRVDSIRSKFNAFDRGGDV